MRGSPLGHGYAFGLLAGNDLDGNIVILGEDDFGDYRRQYGLFHNADGVGLAHLHALAISYGAFYGVIARSSRGGPLYLAA
jgi:hypothetical protein